MTISCADTYPDDTGVAKEKATETGFTVVVADDYHLTLDLDTAADLATWERCKSRLSDFGLQVVSINKWPSKSGNTHVLIQLANPLPLKERVGMEAVLGSDRKRSALSMRGVVSGAEFPCMLFRPAGVCVVKVSV